MSLGRPCSPAQPISRKVTVSWTASSIAALAPGALHICWMTDLHLVDAVAGQPQAEGAARGNRHSSQTKAATSCRYDQQGTAGFCHLYRRHHRSDSAARLVSRGMGTPRCSQRPCDRQSRPRLPFSRRAARLYDTSGCRRQRVQPLVSAAKRIAPRTAADPRYQYRGGWHAPSRN